MYIILKIIGKLMHQHCRGHKFISFFCTWPAFWPTPRKEWFCWKI